MKIQVARDYRTGFPCIRLNDTENFTAIFPVTKLQAEQWIWDGGLINQPDPYTATLLIERMELNNLADEYPERIRELIRVPILQYKRDNLLNILATNLTLWSSTEEIQMQNVKFPTPSSEWGHLVRWLKGRTPTSGEWKRTLDFYEQIRTKDLVREISNLNFSWDPVVKHLLQKFLELVLDQETGLPFMNLGVYELISETMTYNKLTTEPQQKVCRPLLAGESAVWPTLEIPGSNKWRPLLQPNLPVVTIRLWYDESQVIDIKTNGQFNTIQIDMRPVEMRLELKNDTKTVRQTKPKESFKSYVTDRNTMKNRCPCCYREVPEEKFQHPGGLWCIKKQDYEHTNEKPTVKEGIASLEAIHREYLTIAREDSLKIRSVCLSGFSLSGKTTWLLSLFGLMTYPLGNSRFPKLFPTERKFDLIKCSLLDFIRGEKLVNISRQTEEMWIDGDLPIRTTAIQRALRSPVLFKISRGRLLNTFTRQIILNFNDIAGELMNRPDDLPDNEFYPNISTTTDVIFLVPAHELRTASEFLNNFSKGLGVVQFKGKAINQKNINLILAISQIDRLRHSSEEYAKQLLDIFMQSPYMLPINQMKDELQSYCSTMNQVHYDLYSYLNQIVPDLVTSANRFGSVRYCGFSAFGFHPINEKRKQNVEYSLPFEPQPVRVIDPLLWILHGTKFIEF